MRTCRNQIYTFLFLIISYHTMAQTFIHSRARFKADDRTGLFIGGIMRKNIHIWEQKNPTEIRIHDFDHKLNLLQEPINIPVAGQLRNLHFIGFPSFYYAFIFTDLKTNNYLNVYRIDEKGYAENISPRPEAFSNALFSVEQGLYVKKAGDEFYVLHKTKSGHPDEKGFIVQRFDSLFNFLEEKIIRTIISTSPDLEINIPQKNMVILTGSYMNNELQNELLVQRFNLSDNKVTENGFLCGNAEFSSIRSFYDTIQKTTTVFCTENPLSLIQVKPNTSIFSLFLDSLLEPRNESHRITINPKKEEVKTEGILLSADIYKLTGESYLFLGKTFDGKMSPIHLNGNTPVAGRNQTGYSNAAFNLSASRESPITGKINDNEAKYIITKSDKDIENTLRVTITGNANDIIYDTLLVNHSKREAVDFSNKLIINRYGVKILLNARLIRKRYSVKVLTLNKENRFEERYISSHPSYYYIMNEAVKINENSYLIPYVHKSLTGLSILQL